MRIYIQNFGRSLSRMVMPNIGAFIAWGFITALFIPSGWFPNKDLATLVAPLLKYLLPLLIAYTGGRNVAGIRGGVIGAIAVMGVIIGSDIPMFLGAMVMGPLSGWAIRKFDHAVEGKVASGFEMLVNNFSLGIFGIICSIIGFYAIGPIVASLTGLLTNSVEMIMEKGLLPIASMFIELGKVLFLNNAINHGILTPIGLEQAQKTGSSIMFLLEANPGSGFGVLMAYLFFSKGSMKNSAPSAAIIHFLGGIHEIYFPYILMRPILIVAPILGSASAILVYSLLGVGLIAPASPGSIIALAAMSPRGDLPVILLGVLTAATVSFLISSVIIKRTSERGTKDAPEGVVNYQSPVRKQKIRKVVFACDAGMGSSAMGASRLKNKLEKIGIQIVISNSSVDSIPDDTDVVICQAALSDRARKSSPGTELLVIKNFIEDPNIDKLVKRIRKQTRKDVTDIIPSDKKKDAEDSILIPENIATCLNSTTKEKAIRQAGELLLKGGYVLSGYIDSMLEREKLASTYLGVGVAIPHGTSEGKEDVLKTGIVVLQYPDGIAFGEEKARLVIGIAGTGDQHIEILAKISSSLDDKETLNKLFTTQDKGFILKTLGLKRKQEN